MTVQKATQKANTEAEKIRKQEAEEEKERLRAYGYDVRPAEPIKKFL